MDEQDPRWASLGVVGKAALVGIGPFVSIGLFSMGAVLPRLAQGFAGTPDAALLVQLIGTVVAPVFALASPLAGALVARLGERQVYIGSVGLMAIGGAGAALCDSLGAILALRVLLALGVAGGFTAGMAGIARLPDSQRPTVLGLNSFVGGGICLPLFPLVGVLAEGNWRAAFLVHLLLLPMALLALALPGRAAPAANSATTAAPGRRGGLLAGVPVALALITAFAGLAMVASSMYSPFVLAAIGVTEPAQIGQALGAMSLCSLAGSGSYGYLHRRLGTLGLLRLGLAAMAVGCLVIGVAPDVPVLLAGMGLLGAGLALFAASTYAAAIDSIGPAGHVPAAMGVVTLCLYGSQMAFPVLSGTLGAVAGPAAVFLALGGLMLLAQIFALALSRPVAASAHAAAATVH